MLQQYTIHMTKDHMSFEVAGPSTFNLTETIPESGILLEKAPTSSDF